ncbi:branched-chain amino acid aminotransferase, cytosolic [Aspergillus glaucus CBS 516.65]|uniref:Branched-chain-amino-acid aminotransferase n=1 Tax=Aspergillus glaucus CBS 516.65 TaxID=1160497 RepID=A0A1L9VBM3_ASPGL|nr:hypothetical protein ASPGLDRAFT_50776 [Aspergillus glaucus CBS 516.65]OJJ81242.1 hypothetical protein ASPGLDRAFT_50776 [Aspergillus glaucus CBS 516.65]
MGSITPNLDASTINFTPSTHLRPVPAIGSPEEKSHSYCTDHMVTVRWTVESGWQTPEIRPFENLSIPPTASCLHYATECFEGMKAYRGYDGKLRLFRPDCNGERLANSAVRTSLPGFAPGEVKKLVGRLLQIDGPRWLPKDQLGRYLYIRPTVIGNGTQLGVQAPKEALLFIIAVPWPDMSSNPSGLKLLASTPDTIRAWPGGFGYAKLGANYGPSLAAHGVATGQGFDQVLWLFGEERQVTEAGASNFFIVWENKQGGRELVTASLESQVILPGVTRRSVLELARERLSSPSATGLPPVDVVERPFTIGEVEEAWKEGRIIEAFVSGTAYFIAPVQIIRNGDVDMNMLEAGVERAGYAAQIKLWLGAIMYGKEEHEWGYVIENEDGK